MRLIDADAIVEDIEDYLYDDDELAYSKNRELDRGYNNGLKCAIRRIKWKASAIDAVPVVRCKDCQYAIPLDGHAFRRWGNNALNCTECRGDDGFGMAGVSLAYHDGFCDRGVRRERESND